MTKKGLFVALMTVTFAFFRVSVNAEAPTILDPGDVIIGDLEQGAGNNVFVFPDAINLDDAVSDDTEPDALIKWSWTEDGTANSIYRLNGVPPLAGDPTNPGAANRIDGNDDDLISSGTQDTAPRTVTFRNNNLSDLAADNGNGPGQGPYVDQDPLTSGVITSETRMITLFASDCSTYSSVSITVYTADDTSDSVSGGLSGGILTPVLDHDFDNDPTLINGWFGGVLGGTATTGTATGLCMWVAAANSNTAGVGWISPPNFAPFPAAPYIVLVDQAVYRIRLSMYTDQTAVGAIPFWTFGYNNNQGGLGVPHPGNTYGGDLWVLDVAGGANGINSVRTPLNGRDTYDFWFTPNAVLTPQWRGTLTGALSGDNAESPFDPEYIPVKDMNLLARILDNANGANSIHNEVDTGTVCVKQLRVDMALIPSMAGLTTPAPLFPSGTAAAPVGGTPAPPIASGVGNFFAINPDSFFGGGNGSAAIDNSTNTALFNMGPNLNAGGVNGARGGRKSLIFYDVTQNADPVDNFTQVHALYPIFWQDNQLLQLTAGIRSGFGGGNGAAEGTDPVDTVFINFDTPTSELGGFNFTQKSVATNMHRAASPRLRANTGGVSQTYTSFFFTQNATDIDLNLLGFGNANRVRGYVDFINNADLGSGGTDGLDDIIIDSMVLNVIDVSGLN